MITFDGKIENSFELVKEGRYETILKLEWSKTMGGDKCINCCYEIRKDVEQDFGGRRVFDTIYANEKGDFDKKRINAILSTINNPKYDFQDYDDLIQYLNGKLLSTEIYIKKVQKDGEETKEKNAVKFWMHQSTKYPEYKEEPSIIVIGEETKEVKNQVTIEDEDLPF